jgi:hypothetical protein
VASFSPTWELLQAYCKHSSCFVEPNALQTEAFAAEGIDQILNNRTEKRQIGSRAGNSFSVATFTVEQQQVRAQAGIAIAGLTRPGLQQRRRAQCAVCAPTLGQPSLKPRVRTPHQSALLGLRCFSGAHQGCRGEGVFPVVV